MGDVAREQAGRRLAVPHRAPGVRERAGLSERELAELRPPSRPGAQVRAEARARLSAQQGRQPTRARVLWRLAQEQAAPE